MSHIRREAHRIAVTYAIVAAVLTFLPMLIMPSLLGAIATLGIGLAAICGALVLAVVLTT